MTASLGCEYESFPSSIDPYCKMHSGLQLVKTDFVSACADDDILLLPGLRASIEFLIENDHYNSCHGTYINFLKTSRIDIRSVEQDTQDVVGENPLVRLNSFMEAYHVLFYAVQRTDAAKSAFYIHHNFPTPCSKNYLQVSAKY